MAKENQTIQPVSSRRWLIISCIILALLALGVRLLVWQYNRAAIEPVMSGLTAAYKDDARTLARGDLNLFLKGSDPPSNANVLAHPPGYSMLMSMFFVVIGESDSALRVFQILCDAISIVLVFLIALELTSKRVALIAGALAALSPQLAYNSLLLLPDSLSVLPILLALYLLIRARSEPRRWLKMAAAGAMLGLSCWLRPNGLLLPLFAAVLVMFFFERGQRLRNIVPLVGAAVLLIAPLTIRNIVVFKRFIPISLGSGVTFIEGIADYDSAGTTGLPKTDMEVLHQEAQLYNRPDYGGSLYNPDGIERERARTSRGIAVIRAHPLWFVGVIIRRAGSMLRLERVPPISGSPFAIEPPQGTTGKPSLTALLLRFPATILKAAQKLFITAVMLPLFLVGLFMFARKREKLSLGLLLVVPVYYLSAQSLLHTEYRYVIAIHYFLLVFAAVTIAEASNPLQQRIMRLLTLKTIASVAALALGVLITGFLFIQHNCSRKQDSQQTRRYPHAHLSRAEYEAGTELNAHSYIVKEGDTLERIATQRYDHGYYDRIIKLSNHIEDEYNVKAGTHLLLPNLMDVLTEEGFTKVASYESELILCSRAKYGKVKDQLWALRRDANRDRVIVPEDNKLALLEAASDLEEAIDGLKANKPGVTQAPRSMIGQLEQNAASLRELAEGANDGYGYDLDIVEQRYALALSYGIIWAKDGFK